jgi:hypothetical protein
MFGRVSVFMSAALVLISSQGANASTTTCSTVAACVMGTDTSSGPGIAGTSSSGFGVSGVSKSGHGINGTSAGSFGVVGTTTMNATSTSNARAGVLGEDTSTNKKKYNSGVAGTSSYGYGGSFTSSHGIGLFASSEVVTDGGLTVNAYIPTGSGSTGGYDQGTGITVNGAAEPQESYATDLFLGVGCDYTPDTRNSCGNVASIDSLGNEYLAGSVYQNSETIYVTKSASGPAVESFSARTAAPTLEDVGKAQLRVGAAYVALDRTFASTIDPRIAYSVFITPEGDSNGLYTTQLSPSGFAVRESKGGRSSLTFDYRIVAQPLGAKRGHLPAASSSKKLDSFMRGESAFAKR